MRRREIETLAKFEGVSAKTLKAGLSLGVKEGTLLRSAVGREAVFSLGTPLLMDDDLDPEPGSI